jgi:tetratricopeptide (TPR) repeat protein
VNAVLVRGNASPPAQELKPARSAADAYKEGVEALNADDLDTAVARLQEVIDFAPDVAEPHAFLAQALFEQGEHAAAAAEAERALELEPTQARALYVRYEAYHALGDHQQAAAALEALRGSDQSEASAKRIFNEGVGAYSAGDLDTAASRFLVATELDPGLPEPLLALGEIYRVKGQYDQSLAMTDRVLELLPGDSRGLRLKFSVLLGTQRSEDLRATLDELVLADPDWASSRLPEIAQGAFNDDLMTAARVLYEKIVEIDPGNAKAHYTLGLCYFNLGDTGRAREAMTRFLELAPDHPDAEAARSMVQYME